MRTLVLFSLLFSVVGVVTASAQATTDTTRADTAHAVVTTGYGAWFGSIPNMDANAFGVLLAGVTPESPAAKAGLKKGDLLISMAGDPVLDLADMVEVLRSHPPGAAIEVVFLRDTTEHKVKVVLGVRPGGR
jgi:S1-C subfamily serine protease